MVCLVKFQTKMSLNCLLPSLCSGKNRRTRPGDDRPFPEEDCQVFPVENMYDRIVLPTKLSHRLDMERPDVCKSSNMAIVPFQNEDITSISNTTGQGKHSIYLSNL